MMNTLRSGSRSVNQLLNRFHVRRAISTASPSFLNQNSLLSDHLSPRQHQQLPSLVNAARHLRTGRDPSGGFEERNENPEIQIIVPEEETYVIERSGEYVKTLTAGTHVINPCVDRIARTHSLKEVSLSVPFHTAITEDKDSVSMEGVLSFKVVDPELASYAVEKPKDALIELARRTVQSEVGKITGKQFFEERRTLNDKIAGVINKTIRRWGLECTDYESNSKDIHGILTEEWLANVFASEGAKILVNEAAKIGKILMEDWKRIGKRCARENLDQLSVEEGFAKFEQILKVERDTQANIFASEFEDLDKLNGRKAEVIAKAITLKGISTVSEELRKLKEHAGIRDILCPPPLDWGIRIERRRAAKAVEVVPYMEAYVVERDGKYLKTLAEGTHRLDPAIDQIAYEYTLWHHLITIPHQNLITIDGVSVSFNVDLLIKVVDPKLASYTVSNPINKLIELEKSTVQSELARFSADELVKMYDWGGVDKCIGRWLEDVADGWGLKFHYYDYERKDVSWRPQQEIRSWMEAEEESVEESDEGSDEESDDEIVGN